MTGLARLRRDMGRMFGTGRAPRAADVERPQRDAFRRLASARGWTWRKARDGYLEIDPGDGLPRGLVTGFHGWPDALDRVKACLADPGLVDAQGWYSE